MAAIIFDFDGTIADSFDYVLGFLSSRTKMTRSLSEREKNVFRGISMSLIARRMKIPLWQLPVLFLVGRLAMKTRMHFVKPHTGLTEVVRDLHSDGHKLYIVSSNSAQNIRLFLKLQGLDEEFIKIYGNVGLLGKKRKLKKMRRRNRLRLQNTFYIGDEAKDIKAAKKAKLRAVAVTWGYSNRENLRAEKPDYIISNPSELLEIFSGS